MLWKVRVFQEKSKSKEVFRMIYTCDKNTRSIIQIKKDLESREMNIPLLKELEIVSITDNNGYVIGDWVDIRLIKKRRLKILTKKKKSTTKQTTTPPTIQPITQSKEYAKYTKYTTLNNTLSTNKESENIQVTSNTIYQRRDKTESKEDKESKEEIIEDNLCLEEESDLEDESLEEIPIENTPKPSLQLEIQKTPTQTNPLIQSLSSIRRILPTRSISTIRSNRTIPSTITKNISISLQSQPKEDNIVQIQPESVIETSILEPVIHPIDQQTNRESITERVSETKDTEDQIKYLIKNPFKNRQMKQLPLPKNKYHQWEDK
ncbi:hypothetical protein NEOKW01_1156 [Nematocida sp. AWRm80]|nr:hypothetical protein NEOKW01_1156 [Nematocida sp. AWRm80]